MFIGIEIGGTKLQLGVGRGDGSSLAALERFTVEPQRGAAGILRQIESAAPALIQRYGVGAIGCGFGGPVDVVAGRTIKSHQIEGWDDFPLKSWLEQSLGLPAAVGNDCDVAALAEARYGAGRGKRVVFYVTVGTGIGGGLVIDGDIFYGGGPAAAEIGHMRPGLHAQSADETVESIASGWGIAAAAQARLTGLVTHRLDALRAKGLVPKLVEVIKILGEGEITKKLTIKAHRASETAKSKIEAAGGSLEIISTSVPRSASEGTPAA